ncbi:MAG: DUF4344 domain-containing metallopeptidase [Pseudorhodoplanes sp.]|nr:DUF4344 domain-containing metallopeptidase [Pseudorhodoplanes sp.]
MTIAVRTLALLCTAASLLAQPAPAYELKTGLKTNQFDYEYVEPKNPAHRQIHETMREKRVLESFQEFLAPLRLPIRITLKLEGCDGVANATFWDSAIKVCYEYIEYLRSQAPKAQKWGLTVRDSMIALVVDVFLHEVGHAVLEDLDIPFFGREEDAADYFASYLLLQFSKSDARRLILGTSFLGDAESMERHMSAGEREMRSMKMQMVADPHSLPGQRYFNRLCMAYGADPALFADAISVGGLPEIRAKHCRYEYQANAHAFKSLIAPYIDEELQQQVMARKWFEFETPAESMDKPADTSAAPAGDGTKAFKRSNNK